MTQALLSVDIRVAVLVSFAVMPGSLVCSYLLLAIFSDVNFV